MATKILFPAGVERLFGGPSPLVEEINSILSHHKIKGVPVRALFTDLRLLSSSRARRSRARATTLPLADILLFTMMAPEYYVFTGRNGEVIPGHVTHVLIAKDLKFVPARAFYNHQNIEEVICHDGVLKIEELAFYNCPSLKRVIIPGVKVVEKRAFNECRALTYIEWGKLEIIGEYAFSCCKSLSGVDLPSIKIMQSCAFLGCIYLKNAKFGKDLESIEEEAFYRCTSLERITLPLKAGMISDDNVFQRCVKLNNVDLVEGAMLDKTVEALLLGGWKNDMNEEIDSINQVLPNTSAGKWNIPGGKAQEIRTWITSVLHKIVSYKAEHRRYLNEAATALYSALPNDIVLKNVLPFLELP